MQVPAIWEQTETDEGQIAAFASSLRLHPVVARLLLQRGINTADSAFSFLNPVLEHLHDPFLLADLEKGVERLMVAIHENERIAIHGDYDVDGVTSTVMLRRVIELLGGDVVHFIPERLSEGYGLQVAGIDRLKQMGVRVVVSVDCGIRSQEAAERAKEVGIDLIITDHHEPGVTLPEAFAVINPRRTDCKYPDKQIAGVGVAFKVVQALCSRTNHLEWLPGFLKLVALGTLADVVPLKGENRIFSRLGLERLSSGRHTVGLRSLIEACGLSGKKIGSYEVGFVIGPRINAAGRMSTPDLAVQLLLSVDEKKASIAKGLADQLMKENLRRREQEAEILKAARRSIEKDPDIGAQNILVVWGANWHRGVIGIVASKLVEQYCRPVIVLSAEDDVSYGSGRSIQGFNLLAALEDCHHLFERFGGHKQAAGMTIKSELLTEFRMRISEYANNRLEPTDLVRRLAIDSELPFSSINESLMSGLSSLEPFGLGNRRPVFQTESVEIVDGPHKLKEQHLRMTVRQDGRRFRAVAWRAASRERIFNERKKSLKLAFSLSENTYRGETSIELNIADVK